MYAFIISLTYIFSGSQHGPGHVRGGGGSQKITLFEVVECA